MFLYTNSTTEQVGNSFFHDLVNRTVYSLMDCLHKRGTVECLLLRSKTIRQNTPYQVKLMMIFGCYAIHVKEMLKFLPKVIYLQAMYYS